MSEEDPFEGMCGHKVEASEVETFEGYPQSLLDLAEAADGEFEVRLVDREGGVLSGLAVRDQHGPIGVVDGSHTDLTYIALVQMHGATTKATVEVPEVDPKSPKLMVYLPTHDEIEAQVMAEFEASGTLTRLN